MACEISRGGDLHGSLSVADDGAGVGFRHDQHVAAGQHQLPHLIALQLVINDPSQDEGVVGKLLPFIFIRSMRDGQHHR